MATIVNFRGYMMGAIKNADMLKYKYDERDGNRYLEYDGKLYNVHPVADGLFPIRFEVKQRDAGLYPGAVRLYPHLFK